MKQAAFSPHEGVYIEHIKTHKKNDMPLQHYHDAYEIYLQLEGKRYFFFDNICHVLERGDMLMMKPFDIHYTESREIEYYERYVLNFQDSVLKPILTGSEIYMLLEDRFESCVIHLSENDTAEMIDYFLRAEIYSKREGLLSDKLLASAVLQLTDKAVSYIGKQSSLVGERVQPQLIAALRFMNENYRELISLDDISEAAHMSKYYLCRLFRETTGATVFEYLDNLRLARVHNLLLNTSMTLEEIAGETGFAAAINLSRVFKKAYGVSPREFRKTKNI